MPLTMEALTVTKRLASSQSTNLAAKPDDRIEIDAYRMIWCPTLYSTNISILLRSIEVIPIHFFCNIDVSRDNLIPNCLGM